MASTSASSVQKIFVYDVFLSFRGEDTRNNFASHLYNALEKKGIKTFRDTERIRQGKEISNQLIRAIEESKFYIIVFSKDYASSSWCLDELVRIMECQKMAEHTAYPIFYDVEPTEVRKQSGPVELAFKKLINEVGSGRWIDALKEAANLAGWELKNTANRDEANLIERIVLCILLDLRYTSRRIDENLVGIESRVKKILLSFTDKLDDCFIGIKGIGGGGKSTLARAVFNYISPLFEGKSFVKDVGVLASKPSGLEKLQKRVLKDVLRIDESGDVEDDMRRMCSTKVLLVLDDVDDVLQLKKLAGSPKWFLAGSKIIITTRDEQVLKAHGVHERNIHDINQFKLTEEEAFSLFHNYAFKTSKLDERYQELSEQVLHYAARLPLTIEVLGAFLCSKNKEEWEDAIEKLERIPEPNTLKTLEISYNGLDKDEKKIFLDVACMLNGEMKDEAIKILQYRRSNPEIGLKVLDQKCLLTISSDGRLGMHARIEEMGRDIVRRSHPNKPYIHKKLWIKKDIEKILSDELGTESTKFIKLEGSDLNPAIIMKGLQKMSRLKFLYVNIPFAEANEDVRYLPNTLRMLHWREFPLGCLPRTFHANNLVYLAMVKSKISQLWEDGENKALGNLRFVDLKFSKLKTFDLGMTLDLEMLDLKNCKEFLQLRIPGIHKNLKFLNLSGSKVSNPNLRLTPNLQKLALSIKEANDLPDSIFTLKFLIFLKVKSCLRLQHLPTDISMLERLKELHLMKCRVLDDISENICMLKSLKCLKLVSCLKLRKLPQDLGNLVCLEEFYLTDCLVEVIPDSICKMRCLKYLHLPCCAKVERLPEQLGTLSCLKELNIESSGITDLPESIYKLNDLRVVWSAARLKYNRFKDLKKISGSTASSYVRSRKNLTT